MYYPYPRKERIPQMRRYLERKLYTGLLLRERRHTQQRINTGRMLELHQHAVTLAETVLPSYIAQVTNGNRWLEQQIADGAILASVPLPEPEDEEPEDYPMTPDDTEWMEAMNRWYPNDPQALIMTELMQYAVRCACGKLVEFNPGGYMNIEEGQMLHRVDCTCGRSHRLTQTLEYQK